MDEAKKIRLLLTAMIIGATGAVLLTAFFLVIMSLFWPVPILKGLAVSDIAAMIGGGAAFVLGSFRLS